MPSISEQIAQRIALILTGTTDAGPNVWRDREDAMAREESPAILVELASESVNRLGGHDPVAIDICTLDVKVIACVRTVNWQTVADTIRCAAHQLIVADTTLGQLCARIQRGGAEWAAASADVPFGYVAQTYRIHHASRTNRLDINPDQATAP